MKRIIFLLFAVLVAVLPAVAAHADGPFVLQNAATATGAGTVVTTGTFAYKTIDVQITSTATVQVQGTVDLSNWVTIASLTASEAVSTDAAWAQMRANISACTGCTVTAKAFLTR